MLAGHQFWMPLNPDQKGVVAMLDRLNHSIRGTAYDLEW